MCVRNANFGSEPMLMPGPCAFGPRGQTVFCRPSILHTGRASGRTWTASGSRTYQWLSGSKLDRRRFRILTTSYSMFKAGVPPVGRISAGTAWSNWRGEGLAGRSSGWSHIAGIGASRRSGIVLSCRLLLRYSDPQNELPPEFGRRNPVSGSRSSQAGRAQFKAASPAQCTIRQ